MSEDTWTPPPSRLSGLGFGSVRREAAPRPVTRPATRFPTGAMRLVDKTQQVPLLPPPSRLEGYTFAHADADPQAEPPRASKGRGWGVVALMLFMVLSLGAGAFMVVRGTLGVAQDAPLPASPDYIAPTDQAAVGPDGISRPATPEDAYPGAVEVENADTGGGEDGWFSPASTRPVTLMSTELMEPMSVFVPAAKLYSLARPSDSFAASKYEGFTSIAIPDNPHRSVWHSAGGAMAGTNADGSPATAGTTFLGSHSGYEGLWGSYLNISYLTGGETVWTKDAGGQLQRWQVDRIRYMPHTDFPQEYWKADGARRLVLTTCGGTVGDDGVYNQNVFIEAKPVKGDGSAL